jgi:hypothetical protein
MNNEPIPNKTRFQVFARDNYLCWYCQNWATEVDHVIPRSFDGSNDPENLVSCCHEHNKAFSNLQPDEGLIAAVAEAQHRWEIRCTRYTEKCSLAIAEWPNIRANTINQITEFFGWIDPESVLQVMSKCADMTLPSLLGGLIREKYNYLATYERTTRGAPVQHSLQNADRKMVRRKILADVIARARRELEELTDNTDDDRLDGTDAT